MNIVWFKRDLRVSDHAPLFHAARAGSVIPLYIIEPDYWSQPDTSLRHWHFLTESIEALNRELTFLGQPLIIKHGNAKNIFAELINVYRLAAVWSHQETGNKWTFQRDNRVARYLGKRDVPWHQFRQHGVVRGKLDRDAWSKQWEQLMSESTLPPPPALAPLDIETGDWPDKPTDNMLEDPCPGRQKGGRDQALQQLRSFLTVRGERYHQELSSPLTAAESCSRLSVHLTWGCISIREVIQATRQRRSEIKSQKPRERGTWARALSAFEGRLHWHCHFIQKLESEPRIEFENMQRSMDGLRDTVTDLEKFNAWSTGHTGWPLVDACMRCLRQTGWINFRMRAMVQSIASYHYWIHWRVTSLHLARLFTDYEPGIHYPQAQMQSGTTGINTARIYNPIKQSLDQDPEGVFIRRWVPELEQVSKEWIHMPWKMPHNLQKESACIIGKDYPEPLVDHEIAAREARQKLSLWRKQTPAREESRRILKKHGSRKRPAKRRRVVAQEKLPL